MERIKRFFSPGRYDGALWIFVVLQLAALALPIAWFFDCILPGREKFVTLFSLAILLGLWLGTSVIVGSPRRYRSSDTAIVFAGCLLSIFAFWWSAQSIDIWHADRAWLNRYLFRDIRWFSDWIGVSGVLAMFALLYASAGVVWVCQLLVTFGVSRIRRKPSRAEILILFTSVIFVASLFQKYLWQRLNESGFVMNVSGLPRLTTVLPLVIAVGIVVPGVLASYFHSNWKRVSALFLTCGVFSGVIVGYVTVVAFSRSRVFAIVMASTAFAIVLLLIPPRKVEWTLAFSDRSGPEDETEGAAIPAGTSAPSKGRKFSFVWGGMAVLLWVSVYFVAMTMDIPTLITAPSDRMGMARKVRRLYSDPASRLFLVSATSGTTARVRFSENASDLLDVLADLTEEVDLELYQVQPNLDFQPLGSMASATVQLYDSTISETQVVQLYNGVSAFLVMNKAEVTRSGSSMMSSSPDFPISFVSMSAESLENSLRPIPSEVGYATIRIYSSKISATGWQQIARLSDFYRIELSGCELAPDVFDNWKSRLDSCSQLFVQNYKDDPLQKRLYAKMALTTDALVPLLQMEALEIEEGDELAAWIATGFVADSLYEWESEVNETVSAGGSPNALLRTTASKRNWVVAKDDEGEPISLYFSEPRSALVDHLGAFPKLKRLNLDPWTARSPRYLWGSTEFDLSGLIAAPNLEQLFLGFTTEPNDLLFLSKLPKLKILQISGRRSSLNTAGFEQCKVLEELVLLGTPERKVIGEIAKVKSLKVLKILDDTNRYAEPEALERLKKGLPGVEVEIFVFPKWQIEQPKEYELHTLKLRQAFKEKYFDGAKNE